MPILLSQLVVKPVLCTMALLNVVLMGVCGYLLLVPAKSPGFSAGTSEPFVSGDAIPDQSGPGGPRFPVRSGAPSPLAPASVDIPGPALGPERMLPTAFSSEDDISPGVLGAAPQPATQQVALSQTVERSRADATAGSIDEAPAISIPLAFTTSAEGATPSQAAALGRLQGEFANDVGGQYQNANDPAYAKAWQAAQALSDWNYRQQFGTQAFVQQQLAQVHGGIQ